MARLWCTRCRQRVEVHLVAVDIDSQGRFVDQYRDDKGHFIDVVQPGAGPGSGT